MASADDGRLRKRKMDSRAKGRLYRKGLEAFNSGHFYEAHELWEELWLETPNPDKKFLQGLIQVAAAFHHYSRANLVGTRNLLHAGLLKLECFPAIHGALEIEALREAVRGWLLAIEAREGLEGRIPPRIEQRVEAGDSIYPFLVESSVGSSRRNEK